ncbi:DUF2027 domain-containing protein [Plebeiibacterium sediminum]|uniref:DUF2027 domain-containing protein n=1 Tax=Plebeiibacterium sediminum TaxID=2992112 RepID=A0AAE3M4L6_9BACT|nr:DUF2027 domain-containing protein [Plebeiobacterium sediminum]MCW3787039.1 DUF2027 domain-containing protein [Plebeiobacterium sediminum]
MAIGIGDRVRFLNEVGGGIVSRVEGGKMVFVLDDDGFEVPSLITEVVLVEKKVQDRQSDTVESDDFNEELIEESEEEGNPKILLACLRNATMPTNVTLYLINDSNFYLFYTIGLVVEDQVENQFSGSIEPNTKIELKDYNITQLDGAKYVVNVLMYRKCVPYKPKDSITYNLKFSGSKLLKDGSYVANEYFNEKAYLNYVLKGVLEEKLEDLTGKKFNSIVREKESVKKVVKPKRRDDDQVLEVDLHIHELLDDVRGLSNKEMLGYQIEKFHEIMEQNKKNKNKKIVFIHGVGNGVLKNELRKLLDRKYKWHSYQDASFKEYGFGATMVII